MVSTGKSNRKSVGQSCGFWVAGLWKIFLWPQYLDDDDNDDDIDDDIDNDEDDNDVLWLWQTYSEAEEILLRVTGLLHPSIDRLYLNFGIYYEESGDYYKAFDYFHRWFEVCRDLYGLQHNKTRRPISTLNEPMYRRIASECSVKIPTPLNADDAWSLHSVVKVCWEHSNK